MSVDVSTLHAQPAAARRRRALIVEDEETNRLILTALLTQLGYDTVEVENGADAIAQFSPRRFDLVLMDLIMPGMDGFRATKLIKSLCRDIFVPVLIITAVSDDDTYTRCIDAGGDDVLHKPFELGVLRSKVRALQRIRDLHDELGSMYFRLKRDEDATDLLYKHAMSSSAALPRALAVETRTAGRFNGDVFIHQRGPDGELHFLLGDFSGHGLATAMAAIPTVETFRSMVGKGFKPRDVAQNLNNRLVTLLPEQMFLAAVYVHVPLDRGTINVINCGVPDVLIYDITTGALSQRAPSRHLPLGLEATNNRDAYTPERVIVGDTHGLFACTDGLLNALAESTTTHAEDTIANALENQSPFAATARLMNHISHDGAPLADDVSIVAFHYQDVMNAMATSPPRTMNTAETKTPTIICVGETSSLRYGMHLTGATLKRIDPIPLLVHPMHDLPELADQMGNIYTVMTELFVNALDHGVLDLDSRVKAEEDGFARYFQLRDERLNALRDGFVDVQIELTFGEKTGSIVIVVTDSGPGFSYDNAPDTGSGNDGVSGRGTSLLREMCTSLEYRGNGNDVRAVYVW